ncbi:MAG: hypothetical protein ABI890_06625 [Lapillicoccus sp.]
MIWNRTKTLVSAAVVAAAAVTGGGIAIARAETTQPAAATPSATSTASPGTATAKAGAKGKKGHASFQEALAKLKDVQHAQWVTKDGTNATFVTHDAIRGSVTAVSSSSITVKAADGVSQTYSLSASTKVTLAGGKGAKPSTGTATDVKSGANVVVTGTGTSSLTADRVLVPKA